ncbi:COP9 signalosome complex subunit 5b-like [Camellia sinensis]|uniref:COP9 signalosome complex subunit 5b-like n=1 Tax=Camellia sinensis TaxID=4442 RepID=UPI0010356D62|nr:COP9 signalosome complex subunit 5b-like [Camellia sinensis]
MIESFKSVIEEPVQIVAVETAKEVEQPVIEERLIPEEQGKKRSAEGEMVGRITDLGRRLHNALRGLTWVVIDPTRTVSAGKVEIGAFRTYPEGYKPPDEPVSEYQTIPLNKIEDFGVHCKQYYSLDITYFKSSLDCHLLDLLWNKYRVNTLSSSPLLGNKDYVAGQISDLGMSKAILERYRGSTFLLNYLNSYLKSPRNL